MLSRSTMPVWAGTSFVLSYGATSTSVIATEEMPFLTHSAAVSAEIVCVYCASESRTHSLGTSALFIK
jgi:hypothetical protein